MRSITALTVRSFAAPPVFALDCASAQKDLEYVAGIRSLSDDQSEESAGLKEITAGFTTAPPIVCRCCAANFADGILLPQLLCGLTSL